MSLVRNVTLAALLLGAAAPALAAELPPFAGNFDDAQYGYAAPAQATEQVRAPAVATAPVKAPTAKAGPSAAHVHAAGQACACHS